ncbi:MAG: AMP-binding protein [Clostridia bacterium]|nr:AMP-binding protein [Clostridia bacterium]
MKNSMYEYYEVKPVSGIADMMEQALKEAPLEIAYSYKVLDEIRSLTYEAFINRVSSLGAFLTEKGFKKSAIACVGKNSIGWITAYFTALRSEGYFVPIDKELPENDIIHLLNDSESEVIFCDEKFCSLINERKSELKFAKIFICLDGAESDDMFISLSDALTLGSSLDKTEYLSSKSDPDDMKLLVYTSGTTGMSKGVMLSERNIVSCVYYGLHVSTVYTKGLSVLPYNHTYEAVADLLVSFHHHSMLCINEALPAILKNLRLYKPDYIYIVPAIAEMFHSRIMKDLALKGMTDTFYGLVLKSKELLRNGIDKRKEIFSFLHDIFGGKLIKIVCGGAPIRPEVGEFFENIGITLVNGYGITECSPLVSANHDKYNDVRTAGIKLPCLEWKIDNPNEEGIGEICVKGPTVMLGYYKSPELTAEVIRDGWFYTGDYGRITNDDKLIISGRKKNIIVLDNGKNVYPEEIESYIQNLDYVTEVIVSGIKDENGIEKALSAEVFLSEQKTTAEVLKEIKNVCKELPIYKQISKVTIRDKEFEKTASNKIKRFIGDKIKKKN